MIDYISIKWLIILVCGAGWTTFFSFFNTPGVRGYRNLGILGCYILGIIMMAALPWRIALATWTFVGVASGLLYVLYDSYAFLAAKDKTEASRPRLSTIVHGLFAWPVMLPEAIEYWLADLGILKATPIQPAPASGLPSNSEASNSSDGNPPLDVRDSNESAGSSSAPRGSPP